MGRWIYLSYELDMATPAYGNGEGFTSRHKTGIEKGDSSNSSHWSFPNHLGTHIDVPAHFYQSGQSLSDYPAESWIFKDIFVIELTDIKPGQIIMADEIPVKIIPSNTELLLLKTGFSQYRSDEIYWSDSPGYSPGIAEVLREQCPQLKALGIDTISISSWANREVGRTTHRAFLDPDRPVILIEDMDLSYINEKTRWVQLILGPLRIKAANGTPCVVLGEIIP